MAANSDDIREEILRLRSRMHNVESELIGLKLHNESFKQWRDRIAPVIEDLREADRIAEAVATKMGEQRTVSFTKVQKWAAILGVAIAGSALLLTLAITIYNLQL